MLSLDINKHYHYNQVITRQQVWHNQQQQVTTTATTTRTPATIILGAATAARTVTLRAKKGTISVIINQLSHYMKEHSIHLNQGKNMYSLLTISLGHCNLLTLTTISSGHCNQNITLLVLMLHHCKGNCLTMITTTMDELLVQLL